MAAFSDLPRAHMHAHTTDTLIKIIENYCPIQAGQVNLISEFVWHEFAITEGQYPLLIWGCVGGGENLNFVGDTGCEPEGWVCFIPGQ